MTADHDAAATSGRLAAFEEFLAWGVARDRAAELAGIDAGEADRLALRPAVAAAEAEGRAELAGRGSRPAWLDLRRALGA